jgi:tetratricopeptide (TPR) repeat protein
MKAPGFGEVDRRQQASARNDVGVDSERGSGYPAPGMSTDLDTLLTEGRDAYQRGDYAQAEERLAEALKRGAQDYADVRHTLGVIYHSWGLFSKARAEFEEALRINPVYTEAALNLSITYNDLGRYAEAQEVLSRAFPTDEAGPLNALTRAKIANLHATVGDAYRSADLPKEAANEYRRALGLCDNFVDIRTRLAQALSDAGHDDEAVEELRLALKTNENFIPAMLQLGLLLYGQKKLDESRKILERVLELRPEHERASGYLRMLDQGEE